MQRRRKLRKSWERQEVRQRRLCKLHQMFNFALKFFFQIAGFPALIFFCIFGRKFFHTPKIVRGELFPALKPARTSLVTPAVLDV